MDRMGSKRIDDISYLEPLSRHRNVLSLYGQHPVIAKSAYVAPNATVFGDVYIARNSYIGFGSVANGVSHAVRIGADTKIGDNTVVQPFHYVPDNAFSPSVNIGKLLLMKGNNVNIEHNCCLSSCYIDDNVHVGFKSVIAEGAQLERGCWIAPNSYVPAGRRIPENTMWAGSPVKFVKELKPV